tara:strand:- start:4338 stop:5042 length:705 start_codon:yes stop_codon:yes gene_type:complete
MSIKIFESKVLETKYFKSNIRYLKLSIPKDFKFKPGQYLLLSYYFNGKKFKSPYSIASIPNKKFIEFCIKLSDKGKSSNFIKNLKKGDKVELLGPAGKFVIDNSSKNNDLIFICVGTGITPFISMISFLLKKGFKNNIILLKGFRNENKILYEKEFSLLRKKHKNFEFHNILSQPKNKNFKNKGYVQHFLDKYIPENFNGDFYICGLDKMVDSVIKKLKEKNIGEKRIFFEKYD